MKQKDLYEDLIRFYEFQLGRLPYRDEFKAALRSTFSAEDLRIFFLLPFLGMISEDKFERRAAKAGLSAESLHQAVRRLAPEGLIDTYIGPQGRVYGRSPSIALLEFQVRLKQASPMRDVCTKVMNAFIEGAVDVIPTRTPYYRVLPVESTLTGAGPDTAVPVDVVVPDPREVLPIDVVSQTIRKEPLVAVAECYCRSAKRLIGEDCGHPMETCFYFNELALLKLETGYAREIDHAEAMRILWDCEKAGLVHNVSNCEGRIQTLCNCCTCCCGLMKAMARGKTNVGAPSRYHSALAPERCTGCGACMEACPVDAISWDTGIVELHATRCIGCGHCVGVCPESALHMVLRKKQPRIYPTNEALFRRINTEAMIGLARRKLLGALRRED